MNQRYSNLYFTTATILEWKRLLADDRFKDVIIDSLKFLVSSGKVLIREFVIMPNHIHVIWTINEPYTLSEVKSSLLSYTAHVFKQILLETDAERLNQYRQSAADRDYQFWERNALSVPIYSDEVFRQKQAYIHSNPCTARWVLADMPQKYKYSSAYSQFEVRYWDFVSKWFFIL